MSKSISELALFWAGRSGCFEAATKHLLQNPSEESAKYWAARMEEWDQEKVVFMGEDVASKEVIDDISVLTTNPILG